MITVIVITAFGEIDNANEKKKMTRLPSANDGGHESDLDLMEMLIEIILQSIEV